MTEIVEIWTRYSGSDKMQLIAKLPLAVAEEYERRIIADAWEYVLTPPREIEKGPSKPVEVYDINPEVFQHYLTEGGRNGQKAIWIEPGVFNSAQELSRVLGFKDNQAAKALNVAKGAGNTEATLRGVSFRYVEDARE